MAISSTYRPSIVETTPVRIELDGWAAGGDDTGDVVDAQGTQWVVNNFDGWQGAPGVRTTLTERPSEHGSFDGPSLLQPRVITVEGIAYATDRSAAFLARDIVASVCGDTTSLQTLVVHETGRPTKRASVRRSAETKTGPITDSAFAWSMILVAPDPRRYADDGSSRSVGLTSPGSGGLVFPLVFPLVFGSTLAGAEVDLVNSGTIPVFPTFTLAGPVTGPIIRNLTTGQRLEFDPTFALAAGETLTIDADAKTVMQVSTSRRDRLFTAQWFKLDTGTTRIRLDSVGSYDPVTLLTATWRDGWV